MLISLVTADGRDLGQLYVTSKEIRPTQNVVNPDALARIEALNQMKAESMLWSEESPEDFLTAYQDSMSNRMSPIQVQVVEE